MLELNTRQRALEGVGLAAIGLTFVLSITLLFGGVLSPMAVEAQPAVKVARVGVLALANVPPDPAFFQGLLDLGYVEGRNLVIEYRSAMGNPERLPAFATELVALKVDLIVAPSTAAARAAKKATATLPIVSLDYPGHERPRRQPCAAGRQRHGIGLCSPRS